MFCNNFKNFKRLNTEQNRRDIDDESFKVLESFEHDFSQLHSTTASMNELLQMNFELDKYAADYEMNPTLPKLERLIRLRFKQAQSLGKSSPAQLVLQNRHFKTSQEVLQFLDSIPTFKTQKILACRAQPLSKILTQLCELTQKLFDLKIELKYSQFCGIPVNCWKIHANNELIGTIMFAFSADCEPAHYNLQSRMLDRQPAVVLITSPIRDVNSVSFTESQSIFHEFGHALHSVLSETRFQTFSGTRGSMEIAEIPSTLFECLHSGLFDVPVHPIDERQVLLAKFDQLIHSKPPGKEGYILNLIPKGLKQVAIPHLASYGASYYVYPLSKHVANQWWTLVFKRDPWNTEAASLLKQKLLTRGGLAKLDHLLI